ncbi:S53 family peptidase [Ferrimicrobium sp.]|uniref:S53 family peptidase n=1 Tax=Ferrimicrobium sp. TaxID=2926050 RepID=UPI002602E55B|nr:S53 family peptidase [Ferrimicrobium sp.]
MKSWRARISNRLHVVLVVLVSSVIVLAVSRPVAVPPISGALVNHRSAPDNQRVSFEVVLRPRNEGKLLASAWLRGSQPPGPYLTPLQFAQQYAPSPDAVDLVKDYFQVRGLATGALWSGGLVVPVTGSVAQASKALGVGFDVAKLSGGRRVVVADSYPTIPNSLRAIIAGVTGLFANGYFPVTPKGLSIRGPSSCAALRRENAPGQGYSPSVVSRYYHLARFDRARTVTVGIAEFAAVGASRSSPLERSVADYAHCLGVGVHLQVRPVNGGSTNTARVHLVEAALDIETLLAYAPGVHLLVYTASSGNADALYLRMVSEDQASILLTTWGSCEADTPSQQLRIEQLAFAEATLQGQTVVAASGDDGSSDCLANGGGDGLAVDNPASQPMVTAVGGEQFDGPLGKRTRALVFNSATYAGASGGGVSKVFAEPPYQHGVYRAIKTQVARLCPLRSGCRLVPDLAMIAVGARIDAPHSGWTSVGGTSLAASVFAAGLADLESRIGERLGLVNPWLYSLATGGRAFRPVVRGGNDYRHLHPERFRAGGDYSLATGLGTPNFGVLLASLRQHLMVPVLPQHWVRTRFTLHLREVFDAT